MRTAFTPGPTPVWFLETKDKPADQAKTNWEQARGRFPQPDVQLSSFQSWDEVGRWYRGLQADRVKPTPEITAGTATAQFFVLFEFDAQAGYFRVRDAQYIAGSEKLKTAGQSLTKLMPNFSSPDGNPVRIVRRGTIICGEPSGCEFMLPDASAISGYPISGPAKDKH